MWKPSRPDPADIVRLNEVRKEFDLTPLVIHDSYLINLASCEAPIRSQSIAALRGEIERAIAIGAEYLVMHPGHCKGQTLEQGLMNVIEGLTEAAAGLSSETLTLLLENTVGASGQIGGRFEELAVIRNFARERIEMAIGYCLDTCHCYASGNYNVATSDGLRATVKAATEVLGIDHVRVIHANDSKGGFDSGQDRHDNLGSGKIDPELVVAAIRAAGAPAVVETPGGVEGQTADIALLRERAGR